MLNLAYFSILFVLTDPVLGFIRYHVKIIQYVHVVFNRFLSEMTKTIIL